MTETATLPGLETVDPPMPEGEPKRWIERGPQKRLMLFSGWVSNGSISIPGVEPKASISSR